MFQKCQCIRNTVKCLFWGCYRLGSGWVQVVEGAQEKEQKQIRTCWKSFGMGGKQKGLGFNLCVVPLCTQCPISESWSDRKGNRENWSWYSDWRYRRKHLSIYTNYVFHLEQVWKDGEWGTYIKWLEKHKGICGSHSKVRPNYAEIPRMCLEQSRRVRTHRNHQKVQESIERHEKLSEAVEDIGSCRKCQKLQNVWLVTGKTSEGLCDRPDDVTVCDRG